MAERALSIAIGDAFVSLIDWGCPLVPSGATALLERVADAVRPDPPLTLCTPDGVVLTGVAVLERGRVLAFLGSRHSAQTVPGRPQFHHYDEPPPWAQEFDPYRR